MRIILNLIILVLLSTFISTINSQYVLIKEYQYYGKCNSSSSSSESSSGSAGSWSYGSSSSNVPSWSSESSAGSWSFGSSSSSSDFTFKLSSSSSSSTECGNSTVLYQTTIAQDGKCVPFGGSPSIFSTSSSDGSILLSIYDKEDFNCQSQPIDELKTKSGECINVCNEISGENGMTFDISSIDTVNIPTSNTIVQYTYQGECNVNYQQNFLTIQYQQLNSCTDLTMEGVKVSGIINCNSTDVSIDLYSGFNCKDQIIFDKSEPLNNQCNIYENVNILQLCLN